MVKDDVTRIFLLDEHPLIRDGLKFRLSSVREFSVVGDAGCASDALTLLGRIEADVLVANMGPKELGALEFDQVIGQLSSRLAILISTRHVNLRMVSRAMRAGARGYLLHECSPQQLADAIHVVVSGGTFMAAEVASHLFRDPEPDPGLTSRETSVLHLVGQGQPSKVIAKMLGISLRTVESHRSSIKRKLCVEGQAGLMRYAMETIENGAF